MSLRQYWYSFFGSLALAGVVLGSRWVHNHWDDPDLQTVTVNFAVSWIPFLVTVLVAFVPDLRRAHIAWRVGIVGIGLVWSLLLARQQVLTMNASRIDQKNIVTTAVTESNQHSDKQFSSVRTEVQGVKDELKATETNLASQLTKTGADINTSISKVGTTPVKYAQLQFSLFRTDTSQFPITTETLTPEENGDFSVDFTATNVTDTSATNGELWVIICDDCVFTKEPQGFDKPAGSAETTRHKKFGDLNPGVSVEKMTVEFKASKKFTSIPIGFRYSCTTCGKLAAIQSIKITASYPTLQLPPVVLPKLN